MHLESIQKKLKELSSLQKAKELQRFFKTNKGDYGEGDQFLGIIIPELRKVAKSHYKEVTLSEIHSLLQSPWHEERWIALCLLVFKCEKASPEEKESYYNFYLKNSKYINNWDLVDVSAEKVIGSFLFNGKRDVLFQLSKSENLWERRISIMSTFFFIKKEDYKDTLEIAQILLKDKHDLIHKAVGWMLREIGNRSIQTEEDFLKVHYKEMPRTMLRYAIEKFPEEKRQAYLKGKIE